MQEFKEGQRVRVEFEGVVVSEYDHDACLRIKTDQGFSHYVFVNRVSDDSTGAKVTLADPKDWPPQVGDIWEAEGAEWFIRKHMDRNGQVVPISENGRMFHNQNAFKALYPVLVRRRNAHPAEPVRVERSEGQ